MAGKRKRGRSTKLRRSKRQRTRRARARYRIPKGVLGGFPRKKFVKLRYADTFDLNAHTGSYDVKSFRCNSLHDPDKSGVGHQPAGFDRWAAVYEAHCVIGSKISATFATNDATNSNPSYVGIKLSQNPLYDGVGPIFATDGRGISNLLEQPSNNSLKHLIGNSTPSQNTARRVTMKWGLRKMYPGAKLADTKFIGKQGLIPTETSEFQVYSIALGGADNPGPLHVTVIIDYLVVFFERLPSLIS